MLRIEYSIVVVNLSEASLKLSDEALIEELKLDNPERLNDFIESCACEMAHDYECLTIKRKEL